MRKTANAQQEAGNSVESKVLNRLKQEASFISAFKNMDAQQSEVEK